MLSKSKIKYIKSLELRKHRKEQGLFVAEGPKMVEELLFSERPEMLFATREWFEQHAEKAHTQCNTCECITEEELGRISFLQHPQQVLAVFHQQKHLITDIDITHQLSLALDQVQDPGNLGTIVRIADWFGIDTILCNEGTADIYNPKALQATMGSIAHVKVVYTQLDNLFDMLPDHFPIYGTTLDGEDIYETPLEPCGIIVMGNEGNGISEQLKGYLTHRLYIPNFAQGRLTTDSLNVGVATAVVCSEFKRRMKN